MASDSKLCRQYNLHEASLSFFVPLIFVNSRSTSSTSPSQHVPRCRPGYRAFPFFLFISLYFCMQKNHDRATHSHIFDFTHTISTHFTERVQFYHRAPSCVSAVWHKHTRQIFSRTKQNVESIAKYAFKHREPDDETKYYDTPASKLGNSVRQERNTESNSARKQLTRVQAKTIVQLAAWFFRPIYRPKVRFNPLTLFSANPLLATCALRVSLDQVSVHRFKITRVQEFSEFYSTPYPRLRASIETIASQSEIKRKRKRERERDVFVTLNVCNNAGRLA